MSEKVFTSDIVKELSASVRDYPRRHPYELDSEREYRIFMSRIRPELFEINKGSYAQLLKDMNFIEELIRILKAFGMDMRGSQLTSHGLIQDCVKRAGQDFDLMSSANLRLETLTLKQKVGNETANTLIRRVYTLFSQPYMPPISPYALSLSGGVVIASKAMHMIMPELFIMIDSHVARMLNKICDYYPHPTDGENWADVVQNYSWRKLNPSSTTNWDDECYIAALMYCKRIAFEWCQRNNTDVASFLDLDAKSIKVDLFDDVQIKSRSVITRVIDKALR